VHRSNHLVLSEKIEPLSGDPRRMNLYLIEVRALGAILGDECNDAFDRSLGKFGPHEEETISGAVGSPYCLTCLSRESS
jgi:hypothetical protein